MEGNKSDLEYLDCTIRDGGYRNNWSFSTEEVFNCYKSISDSNIDYFEVGFMRERPDSRFGKWHSVAVSDIQDLLDFHSGCKIAVMVSVEGNQNFSLPHRDASKIDLVRVHLRVGETSREQAKVEDAFKMASVFMDSGYEVTLNLASADKLGVESIISVSKTFGDLPLKAIYIADTFGNMNEDSTADKISLFKSIINPSVPIGFHPHNNLGNALAKSKSAVLKGAKMLDMTVLGLGRGAGNLRSEFLAMDQESMPKKLNLIPLLRACDALNPDDKQRTSVIHAITAKFNIHPKYESLCEGKSLEESYAILQKLNANFTEDSD